MGQNAGKTKKMISVDYGSSKDVDSWMRLVRTVSSGFPGLETQEALTEHCRAVLDFMSRQEAICAKQDGEIVGVLLFSRENNILCFLAVDPVCRRQHIAEKMFEFMLPQMNADKAITVTTYREGIPEGIAARAFYQKLGFVPGKLTVEFESEVQEFVRPAVVGANCPCKKTKCERYGNCDACRAYHSESKRKRPCERSNYVNCFNRRKPI